jgi:diacylglycerol kinase family enzyme
MSQRVAAIGAILVTAVVVVVTLASALTDLRPLAVLIPLIAAALTAAWYAITRTGGRRHLAIVVLAATACGFVAVAVIDGARSAAIAVARILMLAAAVLLARFALGRDVRSLKRADSPGTAVAPAGHGVLIVNLKSGGGKAERQHLVEHCRQRGIETVVLGPGDDLEQLARAAVDAGADVIGMAGGDGSQAVVASVASERGVAMVVVPAGTRNHLALDLGLDRRDVLGALDAFGEARERRIDIGDVNGRAFVNNVSLGLYATIVRSPEYRDAKIDTALSALPTLLGPGSRPFDLNFSGPRGEHHAGAHLIQISNNPYGRGSTTRPRLDSGRLGVLTLEVDDDKAFGALLAAATTGNPERFPGLMSWAAESFEVTSHCPVDAGLDGEAVVLDPPLRFSIRPTPLHVRLPNQAIGYSPAALTLDPATAVRGVWRVALGRPAQPLLAEHGDRDVSLAESRYTMPITPSDGWLREE